MERALMKQRAGIVQRQVAAGREFKVRLFLNFSITSLGSLLVFLYFVFVLYSSLSFHFRVVHFTASLKSLCSRCVPHSARQDFTSNFSIIFSSIILFIIMNVLYFSGL